MLRNNQMTSMTAIGLLLLSFFISLSFEAIAEVPGATLTQTESMVIGDDGGRLKSPTGETIAKIAYKQLVISDMEMDLKIEQLKAQRKELKEGKKDSEKAEAPPMNIPSKSAMVTPVLAQDNFYNPVLLAVYGRANDLTADIEVNGVIHSLKSNLGTIDGWQAISIKPDLVVLQKGKNTKRISIAVSAEQPKTNSANLNTPALPPINGF